jgi:hypothetical protein
MGKAHHTTFSSFPSFPPRHQKTIMQAALSTRASVAVAVRPAAAKSSAFKVWQPVNSTLH